MKSKALSTIIAYLGRGDRIRRDIAARQRVLSKLPADIPERIARIVDSRKGSAEIVKAFKPILRETASVYAADHPAIDAKTALRFNKQYQAALDAIERVTGKKVHELYRSHRFAPGPFSHSDWLTSRTASGAYRGGGAYHNPVARGIPPLSNHYDDKTELRSLRDMLSKRENAQASVAGLRSQLRLYYLTNASTAAAAGAGVLGGGAYLMNHRQG